MVAALDGIRVVELGRMVAAPYCARLLADLGAECVKVEQPGGDPARRRGALFAYLNTNKRGVVLDPATAEGATALRRLLATADVFVSDAQPVEAERMGLLYNELAALNPRLIHVSVTPFGMSGPRANDRGGELVEWAAGGFAHLTPAGGRREGGRPLKTAGFQAGFMAGASAALGAMAALYRRGESDAGQHVDVSVQETLVCANDPTFAPFLVHGSNVPTRLVESSFEFLPCKDGYVSLLFVREDQWQRMLELMGNPEWAAPEVFGSFAGRRANWDAVSALLAEYFMQFTRAELYRTAQARCIPLAPVNSAADVLASEHLRVRDAFVQLPLEDGRTVTAPGPPVRLTRTPATLRRPAPRLGEHTVEVLAAAHPLATAIPAPARTDGPCPPFPAASLRVLDFTWVWAGPQSCRFLADLGAEVIKVESDRRIDNYRTASAPDGTAYGLNRAPGFNALNRNKRSVRINLRSAEGRALALRLAAVSDLVVENFAPRVMPGFGLSWSDFAAVNPAIVMLSMSGFGGSGPEKDNILYGNSQVALCGLGHASGFPGGPPENVGMAYGDPVAAYHAAFAALAAVLAARRDGLAQHIDMSQWEAMLATAPEGLLALGLHGRGPQRQGNRDAFAAPYGYYRCRGDSAEDRWIGIAVETEAQWQSLCEVMGRPAWSTAPEMASAAGRLACVEELDRLVESWTVTQEAEALVRRLQAAGMPVALVASVADLAADPHLAARSFFETIEHPETGHERHVGVPFKLSESPSRLHRPAPLFGGDGEYVLRDLLGLSDTEIQRLAAAGALE